ncbi:LYR motif-containing protein 4 [Toxocara canis]|uniref:LYR motif-containing protein 4 n=1 Tax=Toxocara canis TaxID=6265 RepID=A0A0B2W4J6_TOXCA|nr:LYR motif-containing protein 4 [Toxocara canis]
MGSVSKEAWIKIYKELQHAASRFPQYYYREFFKRRIRDHFGAAAAGDEQPGAEHYKKAEDLLTVLRRQATVSESYPSSKLVIEKEPPKSSN